MKDTDFRVIWQKDVWMQTQWAYGRVVYRPSQTRQDGTRTGDAIKFEVSYSRDAMNAPVWQSATPFESFLLECGRAVKDKPVIEESRSMPPKLHD